MLVTCGCPAPFMARLCATTVIAVVLGLTISRVGPVSAEPAPLPSAVTSLDITFTGRTGGLSSGRSSGSGILLLWDELTARGGSTTIDASGPAILRRGDELLLDPVSMRASSVVKWLKAGAGGRAKTIPVDVIETDQLLVFRHPDDRGLDVLAAMKARNDTKGDEPALKMRRGQLRIIQAGKGPLWHIRLDGKKGAVATDLHAWDYWWGIQGSARLGDQKARYFMMIKQWGDGARRARLLAKRRRDGLLLSSGEELSTFDRLLGKPSALRKLEWQVLSKLGYDALVPGRRELHYGIDRLRKAAKRNSVPLLATNLYEGKGKRKGKAATTRIIRTTVHGVRVAILGFVSADALLDPRQEADRDRLEVRDAVAEATRAVDEIRRLPGAHPEVVIAVTNMRRAELDRFIFNCYGVDVVLGQAGTFDSYRPAVTVDARDRHKERLHGRLPLAFATAGTVHVGRMSIDLALKSAAGGRPRPIRKVRYTSTAVSPDLPRDETISKAVLQRFIGRLARNERKLLPSLEELAGDNKSVYAAIRKDPEFSWFVPEASTKRWRQLWFTARLWSLVVANVLRRASQTEVAIVPRQRHLSTTIPGPLLESYVVQWLDTEDPVRLYRLTGAQVLRLARQLGDDASVTGLDLKSRRIAGRRVVANERYSVAMTASLSRLPAAAKVLTGQKPVSRLALNATAVAPDSANRNLALRDVVLANLRSLRDKDPTFSAPTRATIAKWLLPAGRQIEPRWTFAIKKLNVSFTRYSNHASGSWLRFPGVREQRVVTPDNYSLGLRTHLAGGYSSAKVKWLTSLQTQFARTVIDLADVGAGEVIQENADDVLAQTEMRLRSLQLRLGKAAGWALVPFINATYDTEFTATTDNFTKKAFPHQKELRASAGVVLRPGGWLSELRLAGLTKTDFAATQGQFEAGVLAGMKFAVPVGRAMLKLAGELRWLAPDPEDTPPDLGTIATGQAVLIVPIARGLAATLAADVFAFSPKVKTIEAAGKTIEREGSASLVLSAGLNFARLWKW